MSSNELAELRETVAALAQRVDELEQKVHRLRHPDEVVDEETMMAIAAAVSAFLGNRAKVKQVHFHTGRAWAQAGRQSVQRRQVSHVR